LTLRSTFLPRSVIALGAAVLLLAPLGIWLAVGSGAAAVPHSPSPSIGNVENRSLPSAIADLPLENQAGRTTTLGQLRGRVVMVVPFLTSCQEECPIMTGALLQVDQSIARDGLAHRVVIAEISVDPGRDTPARLAAYAALTGSNWPLLTGSSTTLAQLWHYFGVYYQRVAEGSPPGIDWETHQPYTYDVDHSDGFILLDTRLHVRFTAGGMVKVSHIPRRLRTLLDGQGESNLEHPGGGSWTVSEGLDAIGWTLGRAIPLHA
jgi:protein SCO1/2